MNEVGCSNRGGKSGCATGKTQQQNTKPLLVGFIRMHLSSDFVHEGLKFVFYGGIQGFMLGLSTQQGSSGSSGGLS